MRAGRRARLLALAAVVAACGCGTSQPARFYTLDATATPDGTPAAHTAVMVGPVSIPAADDQPQFVTQVASNRVEVDEFSRWAAPLSDSIARAVAGDLAVLLGTPDVAIAPLAARFLGISRPSIYRKMARYGLRRSGVQERGVTPNRAPPFS